MHISNYQGQVVSSEKILKLVAQQQEQITQQQEQIAKLQALVETLQAEIRRLKKLPPKPDIKPNTKPGQDESKDDSGSDDDTPSGNSEKPKVSKPNEKTPKLHQYPH
ncbi:hypothetical protein [Candidatus Sororendozoicomonas aggregata]|uniref:hypothetical protein n=1 Tax=Candidatus Sororendozoicomonas aggregata TaxID=3073239 RepID=UPI002ED6ACB1